MARTTIPQSVKIQVLTEAGYRCAVPTCRNILAIDLHHIIEVKDGGPNEPHNLLALCPTCHALYTRGTISKEAINAWKTMLVSLSHAFDQESISNLLFLRRVFLMVREDISRRERYKESGMMVGYDKLIAFYPSEHSLIVSGDGVLKFSHLIASGLVTFEMVNVTPLYEIALTDKGQNIVDAWFSGNRSAIKEALGDLPQE